MWLSEGSRAQEEEEVCQALCQAPPVSSPGACLCWNVHGVLLCKTFYGSLLPREERSICHMGNRRLFRPWRESMCMFFSWWSFLVFVVPISSKRSSFLLLLMYFHLVYPLSACCSLCLDWCLPCLPSIFLEKCSLPILSLEYFNSK